MDLWAGLEWLFRAFFALHFTVDIFNVLNQRTALTVDENYTNDTVAPQVGARCKGGNAMGAGGGKVIAAAQADCPVLSTLPVTVNKNFGNATSYQAPLAVRFGLALTF